MECTVEPGSSCRVAFSSVPSMISSSPVSVPNTILSLSPTASLGSAENGREEEEEPTCCHGRAHPEAANVPFIILCVMLLMCVIYICMQTAWKYVTDDNRQGRQTWTVHCCPAASLDCLENLT